MKQFYLVFLAKLLFVSNVYCGYVDTTKAKIVATNFYSTRITQSNQIELKSLTAQDLKFKLVHQEFKNSSNLKSSSLPYFYVFNVDDDNGFVIVSAEDCIEPILGYALIGKYQNENLSPAYIEWMNKYKKLILWGRDNNHKPRDVIKNKWKKYLSRIRLKNHTTSQKVEPLLSTKWDQGLYYNEYCPEVSDNSSGHALTGCVATAMAQIMNYHQYPSNGIGYHCYEHSVFGTLCAEFGNSLYNWSSMPDTLIEPNDEVAKVMYHCGISVNMDYGPNSSRSDYYKVSEALTKYFNYDSTTIEYVTRTTSDTDWLNTLKTELDNHRPVFYNLTGFHGFVCDGYDSNNYLHMNWGWGGSGDGYYLMGDTIYISNGWKVWGSKQAHKALIGIQPLKTTGAQLKTLSSDELVVYPNPTASQISFRTTSIHINETVTISIFNVLGEKVLEVRTEWRNNKSINVYNLPSGIYSAQIANENSKWMGKFIKH